MNCQQKAKGPQRHPVPDVVRKAEAVFAEMGMTPDEAVAIFYKQTALHGSFPITELIPNEETQETARKARASRDVARYGSVDDVMAEFTDVTLAGTVYDLSGEMKHGQRPIGVSRAMGCWASGAEQKCTTREVISQRNCPRQLFGASVTKAGWQQAGRAGE